MKACNHLWLFGASLLALGALGAPDAAAQEQEPAAEREATEDAGEEEIVVVGSRIRRNEYNTSAPIDIITQEESARAGLISTTEVLQSAGPTGGSAQINNLFGGFVINGGTGINTIGLRGFGATSTLVLLNGRRLTPAGVRGAVGAADLNTIPSALVDRIEILKDGASSVYGSDAVAGVVNIITHQDFEEFILEAQLNLPEHSGGEQTRLSLSGGGELGALRVTGSFEYFERETLRYGDRGFTRCPGDGVRDPATGESLEEIDPVTGRERCWTVAFSNSPGATLNTIGTAARPGFGGPGAPALGNFNRWRPNSGIGDGAPMGVDRLDGFEGVNGGGFGFGNRDTFREDMLDVELITPTRNTNLFLSAVYELPGTHELYGEALRSERHTFSQNWVQLSLDYPNNALLPAELRTGAVQNPLSTFPAVLPTIGAPMPAPYATQVRAFIGFGNTTQIADVEYTRLGGGLRGDLEIFPDWRYDFNVFYGRNEGRNAVQNFLVDRVFNSLVVSPAPAGAPAHLVRRGLDGADHVCTITLTDPGYGCIPAPALTTATVAGNLPSDYVDWIRQTLVETNVFEETSMQLVLDGPLFSLPAGAVQAAFGVEYRTASIENVPDVNSIHFNVFNFTQSQITSGEDSVAEVFGEIEAPLLRDKPFARSLTANLSARYTDYESYGSDWTYKANLVWRPVENLMLRANRGTSYRAPALFEQFLGATTGFQPNFADPCHQYGGLPTTNQIYINCDAEIGDPTFQQLNGVTISTAGGATAGLFAETSENWTLGATWRPLQDVDRWGELAIALDRFSIVLSDSVTIFGSGNILGRCYGSPDPAQEPLCTFVQRDAQNRLSVVDDFVNIANQESEGWDLSARYARSAFGGEASLDLAFVKYTTQLFQAIPDAPAIDVNGRILSPEMSGTAYVNYERGPWTFFYGLTWIDGMSDYEALAQDPATSIFILSTPDYFLHDASVQYRTDDWQIRVGVRNLSDEEPPKVSSVDPLINGVGAVPIYSGFDYFGRQYFVNLSTRF